MSAPPDTGYLHSLVAGLGAALAAVGTWAWSHTHKRIDTVTDGSVSQKSFDAHQKDEHEHRERMDESIAGARATQAKLFDKIQELSDKTEVRFTVNEKTAVDRHIELLNAIHQINPK